MSKTEVNDSAISTILNQYISDSDVLRRHVIAVYLFGSFFKGKVYAKSDVDLAFALVDSFYKQEPLEALGHAEMLAARIRERLGKAIDVVIMNSASLSFAYHTLRNSRCIYEASVSDRILYEIRLENEYQDIAPFIRELRESKRRALLGGN